jgi:hypothetical protein
MDLEEPARTLLQCCFISEHVQKNLKESRKNKPERRIRDGQQEMGVSLLGV